MTDDNPVLFRLNVEVANLDEAVTFYSTLLGTTGRRQAGARCYFTCGAVTLQVLDVSGHDTVHRLPKSLYFTVRSLGDVFDRARGLGCLSTDDVHGASAGEIAVRPWGERSFYVDDPWGNSLCFVDAGTVYEG
ncbi:VOC family protein [Streptomyces turgidiscabies]|uniref:Glyoxalase family protein n=1 Tax=Streptomyces turgidiscabies (strain Car8) TaxID=698760 RepID=L7ESJ4_STRT8|nr:MULTISPECIES: VOC family protein [Streptomyces]ELP61656.1 glyoxalase family protein [Streptomyces turgidiscabies Car8]MDX3492396.1 VOC family protein [Streptomyces turgidiscabies]GAQ69309.1 glyoxalase-like domain protein [Streptomyces turgidiscabies]